MAACMHCTKTISSTDAKKAHIVKDEKGRLVGVSHHKCFMVNAKHGTPGSTDKKRRTDNVPTAYEAAAKVANRTDQEREAQLKLAEEAARQRNEEMAREREQNDADERRADDWREPQTFELEDLTADGSLIDAMREPKTAGGLD